MEKDLAELYKRLAEKIVSMIPVEWDKINYLGEVEKNQMSQSSVFYFEESESKLWVSSHDIPEKYHVSEQIYKELSTELNAILLNINSCFERNNQPVWEQLSFSLNAKGQFNVDFSYDKFFADDGGQVKREVVWAYETFGLTQKKGTCFWKLLDEYLNEEN